MLAPSQKGLKDSSAAAEMTRDVAAPASGSVPTNVPASLPVIPLDFSDVLVKRKNQHGPGIVVDYNENTGAATALTIQPFMDLCRELGTGTSAAPYINVHLLQDGSGDIVGVPSTKKSKSSLAVNWSKGGETFRIDMAPLFLKRPFNRPAETRAYLPVEFTTLAGVGPCIVIRFSRVEFSRMELGSRPRKKKSEQTGPPGSPGTAGTQPDTTTESAD